MKEQQDGTMRKKDCNSNDNWVAWKLRMTNVFSLHMVIDHAISHVPKLDISNVTEDREEEYEVERIVDSCYKGKCLVLQFFSLIVLLCCSSILDVYLLGEVDISTPIPRIFSFDHHLLFVSLTFPWT